MAVCGGFITGIQIRTSQVNGEAVPKCLKLLWSLEIGSKKKKTFLTALKVLTFLLKYYVDIFFSISRTRSQQLVFLGGHYQTLDQLMFD